MISVLKPSRRGEKRRHYDPKCMDDAVDAVIRGVMKPSEAATYYQVPRATIYLRVQKQTGISFGKR